MENKSIRNLYKEQGVELFYKNNSTTYHNPHEKIIHEHIKHFFKYINKNDKILDLCCGSGEVSRFLLQHGFNNIVGCDPFTHENYKLKTNLNCLTHDFKYLSNNKLNTEFDLIICSFALHLCDKSLLPNLLFNLSLITKKLIIISPNKKPDINVYFYLNEEFYLNKVRGKFYIKKEKH